MPQVSASADEGTGIRERTRKRAVTDLLLIGLTFGVALGAALVVFWVAIQVGGLFLPGLKYNLLRGLSFRGAFGWPVFLGFEAAVLLTIPIGQLLYFSRGDDELGGAILGGITGMFAAIIFAALGLFGWYPSLFLGAGWLLGYTAGAFNGWAEGGVR